MFIPKVAILIVGVCTVNAANKYSRNNSLDLPIKYPGPIESENRNRFGELSELEIPEECRDQTFCLTKPSFYPVEKYNQLLKDNKMLFEVPSIVVNDVLLGNRYGSAEDTYGCKSTQKYDPLYMIRDKRSSTWLLVPQVPSLKFVQKVLTEECHETEKPCFAFLPKLGGYRTYCKQRYSSFTVVVEINNKLQPKNFELPSCCSCHYIST